MTNYFYHAKINYSIGCTIFNDDFSAVYEAAKGVREQSPVTLQDLTEHAVKYSQRGDNATAVIISVSETTLKFY
jgi:hypothetical protein